MGIYDRDVKQRLGKDAFNYILDCVKRGTISAQHMKDISSQLHSHVLGNHLRRVESGKACDEAEFRSILSDWFKEELYDLEQKAALTRLTSIFRSSLVNLPVEGKKLEKFLEVIIEEEKAVKVVVLLGESGVGKSSIANGLLGLSPSEGFIVSGHVDSCTKVTSEKTGFWVSNGAQCIVIDTPGLNDSDNQDTAIIKGMVDFLRRRGRVNGFLIVRNAYNPRMNHSFKSMLTTFELTFGEQFWHNVIIVVSSHGNMDSEDHSGAEGWKRGVRELCPKSAEAHLETVVLDVKTKDPAIFKNSAQKVWKLLSDMESFECKDLSAVMTELDQKNAKLNEVLEELARLRSIVGEKVVIFFVFSNSLWTILQQL